MHASHFVLSLVCLLSYFIHLEASNCVLTWNNHATRASLETQETLPLAARSLAILHTAIYDTLQVVEPQRRVLYVRQEHIQEPLGAVNIDAAITGAAHAVLTKLYPGLAHEFDEELLSIYAKMSDTSSSNQRSILIGREVAAQILAWRERDLESAKLSQKDQEVLLGQWSPEPGSKPLAPYWATQPYFVMDAIQASIVPEPLKLADSRYIEDYYHIKRIGQNSSRERMADQTAQALFWDHKTTNPIAYWNGVARVVATEKNLNIQQTAHLLALLNISLADSVMSSWASKYRYRTWRPQEAIHRAKEVVDSSLLADKDWKPLLSNPPYPDYPSAHSACAGAACVVLKGYVGDHTPFLCSACGDGGTQKVPLKIPLRPYHDFSTAASEAAVARIYAGVCFPASTQAGMDLGKRVAYYVLENSTQKIKQPAE